MQTHTWLGDLVDEVIKVELVAGNTMIIPTGWIHAVVCRPVLSMSSVTHDDQQTPADALVFGGNFIHSYNAALRKFPQTRVLVFIAEFRRVESS
jgi:F-box/leucine-rich repeat protein 10/11